jgi:Tfp pilus assembly protein PilX
MKTKQYHLNNDRGSVIVAALMILVLLTIIGFAATNMSSTELNISTNSLLYERAFYTAEAGLERAKESLRAPFIDQNTAKIASGGEGDWTFALDGSLAGYNAAADDIGDDLPGTPIVWWLQQETFNGVTYSVRIWDNDDGDGDMNTDFDGLIYVRADAVDTARGGRCSIEELVEGSSTGGAISGYTAQEGAGSGKVYTSNDAEAISDFSQQLGS